jgi:hypothetical protein
LNPTVNPLWEKSNPGGRKKERKKEERVKNVVNNGDLVP